MFKLCHYSDRIVCYMIWISSKTIYYLALITNLCVCHFEFFSLNVNNQGELSWSPTFVKFLYSGYCQSLLSWIILPQIHLARRVSSPLFAKVCKVLYICVVRFWFELCRSEILSTYASERKCLPTKLLAS